VFHATTDISGVGLDPSKPPPKKAKQLRLERKLAKKSQDITAKDSQTIPVSNISSYQHYIVLENLFLLN